MESLPIYSIPMYVSYLTHLMIYTGKGYQRGSMRRTGVGTDRRPDKLDGVPKLFRSYKYNHTKGLSKRDIDNAIRAFKEDQTQSDRMVVRTEETGSSAGISDSRPA